MTYAVFVVMAAALALLSVPASVLDLGVWGFTGLMFVVGCGMGIGKASVFKYVPDYFPSDVGAVGGLVGMLGALGGFILPPVFGALGRWAGSPQAAFVALLVAHPGQPGLAARRRDSDQVRWSGPADGRSGRRSSFDLAT